jgi:hypothetical protein
MSAHSVRAHSKFSASGAERWLNCPGSVALSEGMPDTSSPWAEEGTKAHEILELTMRMEAWGGSARFNLTRVPDEMVNAARAASDFIYHVASKLDGAEVLVEQKVFLDFIHPEMFGTFDSAIIDLYGTLHVFDYKYGKTLVSPNENQQMNFYAIGLLHRYDWDFKKVKTWIIQPRVYGYQGPAFWAPPISYLRKQVDVFKRGVEQVEKRPKKYVEGDYCYFCKAKSKCPLKNEARVDKVKKLFSNVE